VNNLVEEPGDVYENLIVTQNQQQVDRCNITMGMSMFISSCNGNGLQTVVAISDALQTGPIPRFEAGEVYYFTSECNVLLECCYYVFVSRFF